jgi:hypothetical protein
MQHKTKQSVLKHFFIYKKSWLAIKKTSARLWDKQAKKQERMKEMRGDNHLPDNCTQSQSSGFQHILQFVLLFLHPFFAAAKVHFLRYNTLHHKPAVFSTP